MEGVRKRRVEGKEEKKVRGKNLGRRGKRQSRGTVFLKDKKNEHCRTENGSTSSLNTTRGNWMSFLHNGGIFSPNALCREGLRKRNYKGREGPNSRMSETVDRKKKGFFKASFKQTEKILKELSP